MPDIQIRSAIVGVDSEHIGLAMFLEQIGPASNIELERFDEVVAQPNTLVLVAWHGQQVVGLLVGHLLPRLHGPRNTFLVDDLEVSTLFRRQGVVSSLLTEARRWARRHGSGKSWLVTDASNATAMSFHQSAGGLRPNPDDVVYLFG